MESDGGAAEWATRLSEKPLIDALGVEAMLAGRQHFHLISVPEYPQAYAALAFRLVEHDGEAGDGGGVEAQPRRVEAAHPARVEEEQPHQQNHGEEHHDEEERAPPDLEAAVVEFRVVPLERLHRRLRLRRRHRFGNEDC